MIVFLILIKNSLITKQYDRIDLNEGTDVAKSKKYVVCNYWYFDA